MQLITELATTPYGVNPEFDDVLDHVILVFNVIQNPDGRVAGTRANGNGFDLNRDFLTQSQSEVQATVAQIQKWLPVEVLDLHGYVTPTLIEATTKPHNPSIEYDLWLKWNQPRIDANEAALNAVGYDVTRPINDWCADGSYARIPRPLALRRPWPSVLPARPGSRRELGRLGPFYTPMYAQHVGLDGSTVEMCNRTDGDCGVPGDAITKRPAAWAPSGSSTSRRRRRSSTWSTTATRCSTTRRSAIVAASRASLASTAATPPFDVDNNWMKEFPDAYVIPVGAGQRSDAEAKRLVDWLLFNGIEVETLRNHASFDGQTFRKGSYVVWMDQAHRGLADTALNVGVDISDRISILYAPPAAWSHGYLWGADIAEIPLDSGFSPITNRINKTRTPDGGVEPGRAEAYALEIDSATAVRVLNSLVGDGLEAEMALEDFPARTGGTLPAGTVLFGADHATKVKLATAGRNNGLLFRRVVTEDFRPRPTRSTGSAHRRAGERGEPGHLVAPEPRLRRQPGRHADHDQRGADRSARRLRPDLEHRELAERNADHGDRTPDGVLRRGWRLHRHRHRWGELPHRRRPDVRPHGRHERRRWAKRDHPVAQRGL